MANNSANIRIDPQIMMQAEELFSDEYNKALSDPVEYKRYSTFKEAMKDVLNDA